MSVNVEVTESVSIMNGPTEDAAYVARRAHLGIKEVRNQVVALGLNPDTDGTWHFENSSGKGWVHITWRKRA